MEWMFILLFLFIVITLLANRLRVPTANYQRRKSFVSAAERSFLGALDRAVGSKYRVLTKVRIADVLTPQKGMSRKNWQIAFNRIVGKHFDFLLCDQNTLEVLVAIELDDRSHNTVKTKARDKLVNFACETAGLPLLRFSAKRSYVISDIAKQISQANEIENLAGAIKYSKTSKSLDI